VNTKEKIKQLRWEYDGWIAAVRSDIERYGISTCGEEKTFYEFLLARGYDRYQLSAMGISKEDE